MFCWSHYLDQVEKIANPGEPESSLKCLKELITNQDQDQDNLRSLPLVLSLYSASENSLLEDYRKAINGKEFTEPHHEQLAYLIRKHALSLRDNSKQNVSSWLSGEIDKELLKSVENELIFGHSSISFMRFPQLDTKQKNSKVGFDEYCDCARSRLQNLIEAYQATEARNHFSMFLPLELSFHPAGDEFMGAIIKVTCSVIPKPKWAQGSEDTLKLIQAPWSTMTYMPTKTEYIESLNQALSQLVDKFQESCLLVSFDFLSLEDLSTDLVENTPIQALVELNPYSFQFDGDSLGFAIGLATEAASKGRVLRPAVATGILNYDGDKLDIWDVGGEEPNQKPAAMVRFHQYAKHQPIVLLPEDWNAKELGELSDNTKVPIPTYVKDFEALVSNSTILTDGFDALRDWYGHTQFSDNNELPEPSHVPGDGYLPEDLEEINKALDRDFSERLQSLITQTQVEPCFETVTLPYGENTETIAALFLAKLVESWKNAAGSFVNDDAYKQFDYPVVVTIDLAKLQSHQTNSVEEVLTLAIGKEIGEYVSPAACDAAMVQSGKLLIVAWDSRNELALIDDDDQFQNFVKQIGLIKNLATKNHLLIAICPEDVSRRLWEQEETRENALKLKTPESDSLVPSP